MNKIYIVEDDVKIASYLSDMLEKYNYHVKLCDDFENVINEFETYEPHLVLLDINLPMFDGFYWCLKMRQISICPIIFISARTDDLDQIRALDNGGDDYITKPFHPEMVMAKIRSHLRRAYGEYAIDRERVIEQHGLQLYPERLELKYDDKTIVVSKNEADLIASLMERYPRVAGREDLLEKLWDDEAFVDDNTLNVNMARVRKKFKKLGIEEAVDTVRGVGYRLNITW